MTHGMLTGGAGAVGSLAVSTSAGAAVVQLFGEVDLAMVTSLRSTLHGLVVDGHIHLTIELDGVTFIDSSALGVLVSAQREVRVFRGSLVLASPTPQVQRLLTLTALDKVFDVRLGLAAEG